MKNKRQEDEFQCRKIHATKMETESPLYINKTTIDIYLTKNNKPWYKG